MSLNSDYLMQIVAQQKVRELHQEAAEARLARIAQSGRQPWWRRLFQPVRDSSRDVRANGTRPGLARHRAHQLRASRVAR